jgi:uncharacterized protein YqgC (DUF456 family)
MAKPLRDWKPADFLRILSGVGLVLVGIVGLILPIMPGWIFIIPGLLLLADYFDSAKKLIDWLKRRWSEVRDVANRKRTD